MNSTRIPARLARYDELIGTAFVVSANIVKLRQAKDDLLDARRSLEDERLAGVAVGREIGSRA
ncbi:MAG: hypothetical protein ACC700_15080 [Anaerolineales bacterium]